MATHKIILDVRTSRKNGTYPLKVSIVHKRQTRHIALEIFLFIDEWDKIKERVIKRSDKAYLNNYLSKINTDISSWLLDWRYEGLLANMTANDVRDKVKRKLFNEEEEDNKQFFFPVFDEYMSNLKAVSTKNSYKTVYNFLVSFIGEDDYKILKFEDVTLSWIRSFDKFLISSGTKSVNSRNLYIRKIIAVFNYAINNNITTWYPFKKIKLKDEATRKRSCNIDLLRKIFTIELSETQQKYIDIFKLSFLLVGINLVDLLSARKEDIVNGRLEYRRHKTGKLYSVLIPDEAWEIINKYKGVNNLLNFSENKTSYYSVMISANTVLRKCFDITLYYARHSWATIASSLDIPKDVIAAGLGHGNKTVTDIYIDFDLKKVDKANRRVIDYVYSKVDNNR